jgi:hypothetical protein
MRPEKTHERMNIRALDGGCRKGGWAEGIIRRSSAQRAG